MYKTIDILCEECGIQTVLVNVPSGENLPDEAICELCGNLAPRKISCTIAKIQIEDRCHPGEMMGDKYVSRGGFEATRQQYKLKKEIAKAKKKGDSGAVADATTELVKKQEENKANIGKMQK